MSTVITNSLAAGRRTAFTKFAWAVLAFNIPVILWGAFVRVSFSGDGCGAHWPFCNGQVLPQNMSVPTAIEFTHRMMTGADTFLVLGMWIWAIAAFPKRHAVRRFAGWSVVFLFIEALLGAGLVLFRKVAHDQSIGRAWYLSAHLTNTLLLLAALTITAWAAYRSRSQVTVSRICSRVLTALAIVMFVSVTGAVAALGDTLFPASSLAAGMHQDFASTSNILLRLRFFHPILAIAGAVYLVWAAIQKMREATNEHARAAGGRLITLVFLQIAAGLVNLSLLAPLYMQMIHLLIADLLWIVAVLWAMDNMRVSSSSAV